MTTAGTDRSSTGLVELHVADDVFYHGSTIPGIRDFAVAEECTVGEGLYMVDNFSQAAGYALLRSRTREFMPVVYSLVVPEARLIDLNDVPTLECAMSGLRHVLEQKLEEEKMQWWAEAAIADSLQAIDAGVSPGRVKDAVWGCQGYFSQYLASSGYDGLKASEGGEGDIGNHQSYVLFDPSLATVVGEHIIQPSE